MLDEKTMNSPFLDSDCTFHKAIALHPQPLISKRADRVHYEARTLTFATAKNLQILQILCFQRNDVFTITWCRFYHFCLHVPVPVPVPVQCEQKKRHQQGNNTPRKLSRRHTVDWNDCGSTDNTAILQWCSSVATANNDWMGERTRASPVNSDAEPCLLLQTLAL